MRDGKTNKESRQGMKRGKEGGWSRVGRSIGGRRVRLDGSGKSR